MALLAIGLVSAVSASPAGSPDTTVPTQFIARQFTEVLGRAPTPAEWTAWTDHFQGRGSCIDELRVMGEHIAGTVPALAVDAGGSHRELDVAYPIPMSLSEPVDYTGDGITDSDDAEFFDHVGRAARIMGLVRALFGHEITTSDWNGYVKPYVDGSWTWEHAVDTLFDTIAPGSLLRNTLGGAICDPADPAYGPPFDSAPLDLLKLIGDLLGHNQSDPDATASRDQATLEAQLAPGGEVLLKPGETIGVGPEGTVQMPGGRTLRTAGSPSPQALGLMGRLHAEGPLCGGHGCSDLGLVTVWGGATLRNVWIDGQGGDWKQLGMTNVEVANSANWVRARVLDNRLTNPQAGGAAIRVRGYGSNGLGCVQARAERNVITGYFSSPTLDAHGRPAYVNGIEVQCELAVVIDNTIVDVTGAGVALQGVMRRGDDGAGIAQRDQTSQISGNTVLNAGLSARSAIAVDPVGECATYRAAGAPPRPPVDCMDIPDTRSFDGAAIENNTLWTSDRAHYDVALMLGSRGFWGDAGVDGTGPVLVSGNSSPYPLRATVGIAVAGLSGVTLSGNQFTYVAVADDAPTVFEQCPTVAVGVATDDASSLDADVATSLFGDDPGQPVFSGCVYPDPVPGGLSPITTVDQGGPSGSTLPSACGSPAPDYLYFADASCAPYIPFGYQYGHNDLPPVDSSEWLSIARDLREIRLSGANTVRFSAELVRYVDQDGSIRTDSDEELASLELLVDLAGRAGVYVDLTGLASYETHADPAYTWFNQIEAADYLDRWAYQEIFWEAIAAAMATRTNIAFYDLMNEPLVVPDPGTPWPDWCGGRLGFGTWCWNQPILLEGAHHPWYSDPSTLHPHRDWVDRMVDAIDAGAGTGNRPPTSLGTIGCIGFSAELLHDPVMGAPDVAGVDFMIVHNYPGSGFGMVNGVLTGVPKTMAQGAAAIESCKADGLPLIVEETYSLYVPDGLHLEGKAESIAAGLERWMIDSQVHNSTEAVAASGWLGNYLADAPVPAPLSDPTGPVLFSRLTAAPGATDVVSYRGGQSLTATRVGSAGSPDVEHGVDGATIDGNTAVRLNAAGSYGDTVLARQAVDLGNDFTFEAWFRSAATGTHTIWSEDTASGGTGPTVRVLSSGDVQLTNTQASLEVARGTADVLDGEWHHVVVTRSGTADTDTRIFVDGVETTYVSRASYSFTSNGGNWWFGGRPTGPGSVGNELRGYLDELAVYDHLLTPETVANHHLAATTEMRHSGATMQDAAHNIDALWPARHPGTAGSSRDRYMADRLSWLLGSPEPTEPTEGLHHPVDTDLLEQYFRLDYTRFVQSNARYLGTSGPGA